MGIQSINKYTSFLVRPIQFEGTSMHPNILLMSKLLLLLLLYHGFYFKLIDPFIPFITWLDVFNKVPGVFKITLRVCFVLASISLLFNFKVRISSFIIGSIIILSILACRPNYYNHVLVCGCALFLAGLTDKKSRPFFLVLQLSVIYFGASLHKMLDSDWWSGVFMHNWLLNAMENNFYIFLHKFFAEMFVAKFMSIMAFSTEFLIAILLLFKRYRSFAVWFIIIFHMLLFSITTIRFGHFIDSLMIILIAFLDWPNEKLVINCKTNNLNFFRKIILSLDFDNKIIWNDGLIKKNTIIELNKDGNITSNIDSIKNLLLYMPTFFLLILFIDVFIKGMFYLMKWEYTYLYLINVFMIWSLILFFMPMSSKILNYLFFNKKSFYTKTHVEA